MSSTTRSYRRSLLQSLADPAEAAAYLEAALDDSPASFLKALRNVAQARQMTQVARESGIPRESLYRAFSETGNPTFETLYSVLDVLGLKLTVGVRDRAAQSASSGR